MADLAGEEMVTSMVCSSCRPVSLPGLPVSTQITHCHGRSDRPAPSGVLGGSRCSCPCRFQPWELHKMAQSMFPSDRNAARIKYIALMTEAGHIIEASDG